jgi:hypothetical protein
MNTQERDMLNAFLAQLTQAQVGAKEPEAQTLIAQALAKQPDAGYLLVQRAMQLDFVLQQSQARVAELQAQLERQQPAPQTSFLNDVHAWGRGPSATTAAPSGGPGTAPVASAAPAGARPAVAGAPTASAAPAPAAAPAATTPWASSMMGTVATTAAGVVAGSFLYSGIQSLMGNHNSGGGSGNARNNQEPAGHTENNTVVNNYYSNDPAPVAAYDPPELSGGYDVADSGGDYGGSDDTA